ncbi:MAG: A/G-specific adenine glycosylase [Bacteroidales bacterium]
MDFDRLLIDWYNRNKRDLPWRKITDPYRIWVSEVILQQTRVQQGLEYYQRFVGRFPDVASLANAGEDEVMKVWQGLGYYSRARHMQQAARCILEDHNGVFPQSPDKILRLKGIGEYTAAAIASIAFGEPYPVIDGNVMRVVARYLGIREPVNAAPGKKRVKKFLDGVIDHRQPGAFNQAVMELGALVCIPGRPLCNQCPLQPGCAAFKESMTENLPLLKKNDPPKPRYLHYLVILSQENDQPFIWIKKRLEKDIWRNLYDFPLIETGHVMNVGELTETPEWKALFMNTFFQVEPMVQKVRHVLTHRVLHVQFFIIRSEDFFMESCLKVSLDQVHNYPVPKLIENFLKKSRF